MDIFFEEIDTVHRSRWDVNVNVDDEVAELMKNSEQDDEWHQMSDEARHLLASPKAEKTRKIYARYWKLYLRHVKKNRKPRKEHLTEKRFHQQNQKSLERVMLS